MRLISLIREARTLAGITQAEIARKIGKSVRTVQRWEAHPEGKFMTIQDFIILAKLLDVKVDGMVYVPPKIALGSESGDAYAFLDQDMSEWTVKEVRTYLWHWQDRIRQMGYKLKFKLEDGEGNDITHGDPDA
jgi:transcriptional regulator with XRE-family HTH domain